MTVESWPRGAGVTAPAAARQGHAGSCGVTAAWREPKLALAGHTRAARVLDNAGKGAGAPHRAPGLRCLTWSRPPGLAGGWELGPRRAHSRLGGGRLAAVHSDGHRGPITPSSSWPWLSDHLPRSNRRICAVAGGGYGSARSGEGMRSLGKFSRGLEGPGVDPDPRMPRGSTRRPGRAGSPVVTTRRLLHSTGCETASAPLVGESPGLRLARLSYDAQVAAREHWARPRTPIRRRLRREELRMLRIGIEDKCPTAAFRWHGVPGEDAARAGGRSAQGLRDAVMRADLAGDVQGFACVVEGLLRAVR